MQYTMQDGHILIGWDHIDTVGLDLDLDDVHRGVAFEQFRHEARARRIQMLHDDKGHAAVFGHMLQELFQGLQPASRCANPDDGKTMVVHLSLEGI